MGTHLFLQTMNTTVISTKLTSESINALEKVEREMDVQVFQDYDGCFMDLWQEVQKDDFEQALELLKTNQDAQEVYEEILDSYNALKEQVNVPFDFLLLSYG